MTLFQQVRTGLVVLLFCSMGVALAQDTPTTSKQLLGSWMKVGDPDATGEPSANAPMFFYGAQQWSLTQIDTTGEVTIHHGGTYKLDDEGNYEETIVFATPATKRMIGNKFRFKMSVTGDTLVKIGDGNPFHEKWKRVTAKTKLKKLKPKKVFELTKDQLEAFVGEYDYRGPKMKVTRDGNQLYAQLTGQGKHPIYAESETKFEWRVVDAQIEFVKDKDGKVEKGIHSQGGQTFDVPKVD